MSDWKLAMASAGGPHIMPHSLAGASLLSPDTRYSVVIMRHQLRVYFLQTRQCIKTIAVDCRQVVDALIDATTVRLFYSNGRVLSVNWKDRVSQIVGEIQLVSNSPVLSVIAEHDDDDTYVVVCGKASKQATPHTREVYQVSPKSCQLVWTVDHCVGYAVSNDRTQAAFVTGQAEVVLYTIDFAAPLESYLPETIKFPYKAPITAVAVSSSKEVALGTDSGTIQILFGGLDTAKPQKLLKWHIDTVGAVQFSPDGNYLISGGQEKVLVFWHLDTDQKQFLPRLPGVISHVAVDYPQNASYRIVLDHGSEHHEVLVLSAVDLVSRLSVSSIRPHFHTKPNNMAKLKKKMAKWQEFDTNKLKHDYASVFEVHPSTGHIYFPHGPTIQAYDMVAQEQVMVQHAAPVISTGKVRGEHKLVEPDVSLVAFTRDGEWMCTYDEVETSEVDQLLSKDDKQFALKFWKYVPSPSDKTNSHGSWELTTKIMEPHGNNSVVSMVAAPQMYHDGVAVLTADNKGGLRVWRPRSPVDVKSSAARGQQTAWTMRKGFPSGAVASPGVDVCWSDDGSVIVRAQESMLSVFNAHTFEEIPSSEFMLPSLTGSRIRGIEFCKQHLMVLSKTRLSSYDMVTGDVSEVVAAVHTTVGGKQMMAIDHEHGLVAVAVNYYQTTPELEIKSKIVVFKPEQLAPVAIIAHDVGISSLRYVHGQFIFVDFESRVGTMKGAISESSTESLTDVMKQLLLDAQITADIISQRRNTADAKAVVSESDDVDDGSTAAAPSALNLNTIQPLFDHQVDLETLFDRIVRVVR